MRPVCLFALCFVLGLARAQEPQALTGSPGPVAAAISEPALVPEQAVPVAQKCKKRHAEKVDFDVLINSSGIPVQYYLRNAHADESDLIALRTVGNDRFTPATRDGEPVQVERVVAVEMDLCVEKHKESDGTKSDWLTLASTPVQRLLAPAGDGLSASADAQNLVPGSERPLRVGGSISAPRPLVTPDAHFSNQARKARLQGTCLIQLIVDQHGMPQNPRVIRPLGQGLDEEALKAVRSYRFQPAMKNGQLAVPVMITVEVNFRLY